MHFLLQALGFQTSHAGQTPSHRYCPSEKRTDKRLLTARDGKPTPDLLEMPSHRPQTHAQGCSHFGVARTASKRFQASALAVREGARSMHGPQVRVTTPDKPRDVFMCDHADAPCRNAGARVEIRVLRHEDARRRHSEARMHGRNITFAETKLPGFVENPRLSGRHPGADQWIAPYERVERLPGERDDRIDAVIALGAVVATPRVWIVRKKDSRFRRRPQSAAQIGDVRKPQPPRA
ncbi:MAG: hypothetical protein FD160_1825 [Caulobacteraceae bacterium]|nr:MAG: hypothetical protein FD160_1825 [Caulobacteraceae bacterium]